LIEGRSRNVGEMADHDAEVYGFGLEGFKIRVPGVQPLPVRTVSTLRSQISALAAEVARIEALPKEPDAEAIRFKKRYAAAERDGRRRYTYGAFRVRPNLWYITGRVTRGFTWDQLLEFIGDEYLHTIRVAVEWRKLGAEE
jgi:hypothetical protein